MPSETGNTYPLGAFRAANMLTACCMRVPSGNLTWLWKITIFEGKIHYRWPFSIAMLYSLPEGNHMLLDTTAAP